MMNLSVKFQYYRIKGEEAAVILNKLSSDFFYCLFSKLPHYNDVIIYPSIVYVEVDLKKTFLFSDVKVQGNVERTWLTVS